MTHLYLLMLDHESLFVGLVVLVAFAFFAMCMYVCNVVLQGEQARQDEESKVDKLTRVR